MGALRKQMEADMVLRGFALRTRKSYLESVAGLAKFYRRSPERITEPECESYLLHLLQDRKLAHSSCNVVASALQFLYRNTLKRPETQFKLPRPRVPQRQPQILSREEVAAIFENAPVATSNSPICGQVKLPQGERQEWMDCYSDWLAFARRLAASLSR